MTPKTHQPTVLCLSGLDPSGYAGVLCDMRAIYALGANGQALVTAHTNQNGSFGGSVFAMDADFLHQQLRSLLHFPTFAAIKIGIISDPRVLDAIVQFLKDLREQGVVVPVVYDPVFASSAGKTFVTMDLVATIREKLLPLICYITPNLVEGGLLIEKKLGTLDSSVQHGGDFFKFGIKGVYLKGGHSKDETELGRDVILSESQQFTLRTPKVDGEYRGTGCYLSASLAAALTLIDHPTDAWREAATLAKWQMSRAMRHALRLGISGPAATDGLSELTSTAAPISLAGKKAKGDIPVNPELDPELDPERGPMKAEYKNSLAKPQDHKLFLPFTPIADEGYNDSFVSLSYDREPTAVEPSPSMGELPIGVYPIVASIDELRSIARSGITTVQLRIKDQSDAEVAAAIRTAMTICKRYGIRLLVNDYWQLAIDLGAYGVHLGQEDLEAADITAIKAAGLRLGISSHCLEEAARAHYFAPSYVAIGPVFATTCKSMAFGPRGLAAVKQWVDQLPYPIVAIGGLKRPHLGDIKKMGASGIAVISAILSAPDPFLEATSWVRDWQGTDELPVHTSYSDPSTTPPSTSEKSAMGS